MRRQWWLVSCLISLFAFTATSRTPTPEEKAAHHAAYAEFTFSDSQPTYRLPVTRFELYRQLEELGFVVSGSMAIMPNPGKHSAYIFPGQSPNPRKIEGQVPELSMVEFDVDQTSNNGVLRLTKISVKRNNQPTNRSIAIRLFERRVIEPVRERIQTTSRTPL